MGKLINTMIEMLLETKKWREGSRDTPPICTPKKEEEYPHTIHYVCAHLDCEECVFATSERIEKAILELEEIRKIQAMHELIDVKNL
jgi:hypothetical protein